MFAEAVKAASELPRLHSLLVSWRGRGRARTLLQRRARSSSRQRQVGIQEHHLGPRRRGDRSRPRARPGDADTHGFPEIAKDRDDRKQRITIEDLLTMRSGLESTSNRNYGAWVQSRTGCSTRWRSRSSPCPAPRWNTAPATRTCCRRSSRRRRRRAPGSSRRTHWRVRSASRWRAGRRIRKASTSAGTICSSPRDRCSRSASCTCGTDV